MVVLMVFLRWIEDGGFLNRRYDGLVKAAAARESFSGLQGKLALLIRMIENRRPILAFLIIALSYRIGRINLRPIKLQQFFIRENVIVVRNLYNLQMPGLARQYLLIRRVLQLSAHITGQNAVNAGLLFKRTDHTPEAASGKRCFLYHMISPFPIVTKYIYLYLIIFNFIIKA